jgi:hypothetical protein
MEKSGINSKKEIRNTGRLNFKILFALLSGR